jgi:hypothetical protein
MRKAQISEIITIVIILLVLLIFTVMSRLSLLESSVSRAENTAAKAKISGISTTGSVLPYITVKGIPLEELIGVYSCYGDQEINYGNGKIDIVLEIISAFDAIYGRNKWAVSIIGDNSVFIDSEGVSDREIPDFKNFISYDFVYPKPCKVGEKASGILFVV